MPEGIEIEYYRGAAERAENREIAAVRTPDASYLKRATRPAEMTARLVGDRFEASRRIGKLLLLDIAAGGTVGLRFGMTGRLIVDGDATIDKLEYSSGRDAPEWVRFEVVFADGGSMHISDPRRLGGVELDPDESLLGVDVFALTGRDLSVALGSSSRPLKARLMDQAAIAGLGNLLTDEILWRASLDPARPADSLSASERARLLRHIRRTLDELGDRGGSHTGDLQAHRFAGALCPRDGSPLLRRTIGGRTTYSCAKHQTAQDTPSE